MPAQNPAQNPSQQDLAAQRYQAARAHFANQSPLRGILGTPFRLLLSGVQHSLLGVCYAIFCGMGFMLYETPIVGLFGEALSALAVGYTEGILTLTAPSLVPYAASLAFWVPAGLAGVILAHAIVNKAFLSGPQYHEEYSADQIKTLHARVTEALKDAEEKEIDAKELQEDLDDDLEDIDNYRAVVNTEQGLKRLEGKVETANKAAQEARALANQLQQEYQEAFQAKSLNRQASREHWANFFDSMMVVSPFAVFVGAMGFGGVGLGPALIAAGATATVGSAGGAKLAYHLADWTVSTLYSAAKRAVFGADNSTGPYIEPAYTLKPRPSHETRRADRRAKREAARLVSQNSSNPLLSQYQQHQAANPINDPATHHHDRPGTHAGSAADNPRPARHRGADGATDNPRPDTGAGGDDLDPAQNRRQTRSMTRHRKV